MRLFWPCNWVFFTFHIKGVAGCWSELLLPSEVEEAAEDGGVSLLLVLAVAVQAALPALVQVRGDVIAGAILHKRLTTLLQLLHFSSIR